MQRAITTILALWCAGFVFAGTAQALDPNRTIRQYHHTAWTGIDGVPAGVWAIAQAPDGYLWLGTAFGLYRFDGVRFDRFEPSGGDALLSLNVTAVAIEPNGDVWVGYQKSGISRIRNGHVTNFTESTGRSFMQFARDDETKTMWAASLIGVSRFDGRRWSLLGPESGIPTGQVTSISIGRDGTLWAMHQDMLLYLPRGERTFRTWTGNVGGMRIELRRNRLARAPDGAVWLCDRIDRQAIMLPTGSGNVPAGLSSSHVAIFDRDTSLWMTDRRHGIGRRTHERGSLRFSSEANQGDDFALPDGLSSDLVATVFEDREGNVWTGTNLGLDRFRAANVVVDDIVPRSSSAGYQIARTANGQVYVTTRDKVFVIDRLEQPKVVGSLSAQPAALFGTRDGRLYFVDPGLGYLKDGKVVPMPAPAGMASPTLWNATEDAAGTLWASIWQSGVYRYSRAGWSSFSHRNLPAEQPTLLQYDGEGSVWMGYYEGPLVRVRGNDVRVFTNEDGPNIDTVAVIYRGTSGLLFGGERGLARFNGTKFERLPDSRLPALALTAGIVQTARDTWVNTQSGIVRIATSDLEAAFQTNGVPRYDLFDFRDGLTGVAQQDSFQNTAVAGPDSRLWFVTGHGVVWIDPENLHRNPLPPPVVISALVADGQSREVHSGMTLDAGISSLQIDYTALSLTAAERVRFRYKLDGVDRDWVNPNERRQAFYTNVGPGNYTFRVIAANNDGVWNNTGATLAFTIPPTFLQTNWFVLICVLAGAAALWLLYSLRLRQLTARLRGRLEERLAERERIARELHDTLLQGFQGLMLRFQAVAERIPAEHPARGFMEEAMNRGDDVLTEGRDRVRNLRVGRDGDLARALARVAADAPRDPAVQFRIVEEGSPVELHPVVHDEVVKIGTEAILNAFTHAKAKSIDVGIVYQARRFALTIRDDGVGIEADMLDKGREGHFGFTGMRERAQKISGELTVLSRAGAGTEIDLTIPASVAFRKERKRFAWFARLPGIEV